MLCCVDLCCVARCYVVVSRCYVVALRYVVSVCVGFVLYLSVTRCCVLCFVVLCFDVL